MFSGHLRRLCILLLLHCCGCSVTKMYLTLCNPKNCSTPGFPALHYLPEFAQTHVHWVTDAIPPSHPLSPLIILPSVFPRIRVFSNESALRIRWPEYWSFLISISSSNEYSGVRPVIQQTLSPVCWPWAVCWSESPFCILRPQVPKGWLGNISAIYR